MSRDPNDSNNYRQGEHKDRAREFERIRRKFFDTSIDNICYGRTKEFKNPHYSIYARLLNDITKSARDYATSKNISEVDYEYILEKCASFIDSLRFSLVKHGKEDDPESLNFWRHERFPIRRIKNKTVPFIDRIAMAGAVDEYLELPFRSARIDRILLDVLVATELYAFGDEMMNEETFGYFPPRSPLKRKHPLLQWIVGRLRLVLIFLIIGTLAMYGASQNWIGESTAGWIVLIVLILFAIDVILSTLLLPFAWKYHFKGRKKVIELLDAMDDVYKNLGEQGPLSARFIRERAQIAADKGVIWPAPLFALLDDIIDRGGRV